MYIWPRDNFLGGEQQLEIFLSTLVLDSMLKLFQ